ncbi:MAG: ParB N-terminal domain-containing protein [Candidatus Aenigmarchaeota archaeon]|nr:ParB N-terminal domain-containing protein [Candidatus Aenigmarchaeota archaeon]
MNGNEIIDLNDFEERQVNLEDVFLDPNNPRFSGKEKLVSDSRIIEESIQRTCFEKMHDFGIEELKENIKRVGFLPIDKIVVRRIADSKKYVVVEGNRRITAIKQLKIEHESGEIELSDAVLNSILRFTVYVYKGKEPDIAWIIQGIRHISGIKNWKPYQQAKLLIKLVKERKIKIEDAGKAVGIGSIKSARLMRSYYAYEQSTQDEEFGEYLKEDDFSFFQEAIFTAINTPIQQWLEWDEKEKHFKNIENLRKYLSWIVSVEGNPPRIERSNDVRDFVAKAMVNYPSLFKKFESSVDMHINRLKYEIWNLEEEPKELEEWLRKLKELNSQIENLPDVKIKLSNGSEKFVDLLNDLKKIVEAHLKALGIK